MDNGLSTSLFERKYIFKICFHEDLFLDFHSIILVKPVFYPTGVSGGPTSADLMSQSLGEELSDVSDD